MGKTRFSNRGSYSKILKAMPYEVKKEAHEALEMGGADIVGTAKAIVPVVKGDLRRTIRHFDTSSKYGLQRTIKAGGATVVYARMTEFTPGSAFFFPAYRANKRRVKGRITRAVRRGHKNAIAKHKKG
ncbi:MAG: hypothetical protein COA43_11165 [Robiginitomaculum sp.]|nr:MAG: hypothetical protein COA43_11165 [Robiginitomaculum sp.]